MTEEQLRLWAQTTAKPAWRSLEDCAALALGQGGGACPVGECRLWQNCVTHKLLLSVQHMSVVTEPHRSLKKVTFHPMW